METEKEENLETDKITPLQDERDRLISNLFNQYSNDEMHNELELINQMLSLDTDLQIKTKALKQFFANKLITIQKGKKSALSYKKY